MNNNKELIFIHLSDIHFNGSYNDVYDLDADLRNEMEIDAKNMKKELGDIDGILITGDIAFSGTKEEYEKADQWLENFCKTLNLEPEKVWTVPGNHDVERSIINKSKIIKIIHKDIREENDIYALDTQLTEYLKDGQSDNLLFSPIENYNVFAEKFKCNISSKKPYWKEDFELNDGSTLRLVGFTSVLISDQKDDNGINKLVLGRFQYAIKRESGVEYLTLCHHPPQWLKDEEEVRKVLNERSKIQLFGHKHKHGIDEKEKYLRIISGAAHPRRRQGEWVPRYNWLSISVEINNNNKRKLKVKLYPRIFKNNKFHADLDKNGNKEYKFLFEIDNWTSSSSESETLLTNKDNFNGPEPKQLEVEQSVKEGDDMDPARQFVYRFLTLPYDIRLDIARDLELIENEDEGVHGIALFKRFFARANERKQLRELRDFVNKKFEEYQND